jgi:hypothetical protein
LVANIASGESALLWLHATADDRVRQQVNLTVGHFFRYDSGGRTEISQVGEF